MFGRRAMCTALAVSMSIIAFAPAALAQQGGEYVIGAGDVLSVSVWRHPELDNQVVVRANGMVTFPPVGELMAAGMTPNAFSRELMQRLRDYTRETTQVTVTMQQFNSRAIFLTGQVMAPGRYSFEQIPDLVQLLSQAGGPLPGADLSSVTVIRPTARGPEVIPVDVAGYMRGESGVSMPELMPGDTIDFPPLIGGGTAGGPGLVYVFGEVGRPGAYPAGDGLDVMGIIALAGGATREAKLDQVSVIMAGGDGQVVATVDVERIVKQGTPRPLELRGGDRVYVFPRDPSLFGMVLGGASTALSSATQIMQAYLLYLTTDRYLDDENN